MKKLGLASFAGALLLTSTAYASSSTSFMEDAVQGNLAEVQVGELAQKSGSAQGVKDFGRMLATDHKMSNDKAKVLATKVGATVPSEPKKDAKDEYDKLTKLNGAAFDKEFVSHMVDDHKKDISEYEKAAKDSNPDVAKFAQDTLPTLHHHLETAQSLQNQIK
jgi:putative membrane protein